MLSNDLALEAYNYNLPKDLIAQMPLELRASSRLLVRSSNGNVRDNLFKNLPEILSPGSLLVVNNSAVLAARLPIPLNGGKEGELLLLEELSPNEWLALGKPKKKLLREKNILLKGDAQISCAESNADFDQRKLVCRFEFGDPSQTVFKYLNKHGKTPIPPYIRNGQSNASDLARYQTIFSQDLGSVAAPTAGLHFDNNTLESLMERDIGIAEVTLHVGLGTFLPVESPLISGHIMHEEKYIFPEQSFDLIKKAQSEKREIVVVGTTSLRVLESFYRDYASRGDSAARLALGKTQKTNLYLYPGSEGDNCPYFKPWVGSALLTNFHQPKSSLMMLVSSLIGRKNLLECYRHAVEEKYRFLSYGDACLFYF